VRTQEKYFSLRREAARIRSEVEELRLDKHLSEEEKRAALAQAETVAAERREQTERASSEAAAVAVAGLALGEAGPKRGAGSPDTPAYRAAEQRPDPVAQMYQNLAGRRAQAQPAGPTVRASVLPCGLQAPSSVCAATRGHAPTRRCSPARSPRRRQRKLRSWRRRPRCGGACQQRSGNADLPHRQAQLDEILKLKEALDRAAKWSSEAPREVGPRCSGAATPQPRVQEPQDKKAAALARSLHRSATRAAAHAAPSECCAPVHAFVCAQHVQAGRRGRATQGCGAAPFHVSAAAGQGQGRRQPGQGC
jgi:hypothetical protein